MSCRHFPKLILMVVLSASGPGVQGQTTLSKPGLDTVRGYGIQISYPRTYFSGSRVESAPRLTEEENGGDYPDGIAPARVTFFLKLLTPKFKHTSNEWFGLEAKVVVLPLKDPTVKSFEKAYPFFSKTAIRLKTILESGSLKWTVNQNLPDWNQQDCVQSIHAKAGLLQTPWCTGLHYLTTCLQEASEIDSDRLTYKFEGLSRDGNHYVSIEIPIANPLLPIVAPGIESADPKTLNEYFNRAEKLLDAADGDTFFPPMRIISELVQSLAPAK